VEKALASAPTLITPDIETSTRVSVPSSGSNGSNTSSDGLPSPTWNDSLWTTIAACAVVVRAAVMASIESRRFIVVGLSLGVRVAISGGTQWPCQIL